MIEVWLLLFIYFSYTLHNVCRRKSGHPNILQVKTAFKMKVLTTLSRNMSKYVKNQKNKVYDITMRINKYAHVKLKEHKVKTKDNFYEE